MATLIALDIGNTLIHIGIFEGKKLIKDFLFSTRKEATVYDYGSLLDTSLSPFLKNVEGMIISSVVPPLTPRFLEWGRGKLATEPMVVRTSLDTGIKILYQKPEEMGADRIANAVAGYYLYGGPVIILDFGTAFTIDVVSSRGEYLGGCICPGISLSLNALTEKAALLTPVSLTLPTPLVGKTTGDSIRSGVLHGFASLAERMVEKISKELRYKEPRVIITGGEGKWMDRVTSLEHIFDPYLTLRGLQIIYERNKGGRK